MHTNQDPQQAGQAYIGVDIGGSHTRIGLFSSLQDQTFTPIIQGPTLQEYAAQMNFIVTAIQGLPTLHLGGIGLSIAGRVAKDGRSLVVAPNLLDYLQQPIVQQLTEHFNCPVRIAHDTVCGLLAEKRFGVLQAIDRCAYLTVSTGTGAAIQLRKGTTVLTSSIEIGHQILDGNPLVCLCGQTGCLETCTGGRQLELRLGQPLATIHDSTFWELFCDKLALGLVNLAQLTRIDAVAVSGSIALHQSFVLPMVQTRVNSLLKGATLSLHLAALAENAPLIGAVMLLDTEEDTLLH